MRSIHIRWSFFFLKGKIILNEGKENEGNDFVFARLTKQFWNLLEKLS